MYIAGACSKIINESSRQMIACSCKMERKSLLSATEKTMTNLRRWITRLNCRICLERIKTIPTRRLRSTGTQVSILRPQMITLMFRIIWKRKSHMYRHRKSASTRRSLKLMNWWISVTGRTRLIRSVIRTRNQSTRLISNHQQRVERQRASSKTMLPTHLCPK